MFSSTKEKLWTGNSSVMLLAPGNTYAIQIFEARNALYVYKSAYDFNFSKFFMK